MLPGLSPVPRRRLRASVSASLRGRGRQTRDLFIRRIPYDEMIAWFCHADVCWITPLRDGLNLVAKEYAAARRNRGGVLVLSEFTGASVVLDGAVLTNPYSNRRMDEAIESALEMDEDEQRDRMSRMTDAVESYTVRDWADEQISGLSSSTPQ